MLFNSVDEIIAFGTQADKPANDIISVIIHGRVGEMLELLKNLINRTELFDVIGLSN